MFTSTAVPTHPIVPASSSEAEYRVYALRERETGRHYVGLTRRSLYERTSAHVSQARREKPVRQNGLMEAIRNAATAGQSFQGAFEAWVLAEAHTADEACALEKIWIETLDAAQPFGFNIMPGGSSIGPQGSAKSISVPHASGAGETNHTYPTIEQAVADRNRALLAEGRETLSRSVVYFRLANRWTVREALGLDDHVDGRGKREVVLGGRTYASLRAASIATGLDLQTLRSRLHRLRKASGDQAGTLDAGLDRRAAARRLPSLGIVWPQTGERLTVRQLATRTGLPRATLLHRWHRALASQAAVGGHALSPEAMLERLTAPIDRRKMLRLSLPSGDVLVGGERELIRQVLDDCVLSATRAERLSASGIRRRLRLLSQMERQDRQALLWAFGMSSSRLSS